MSSQREPLPVDPAVSTQWLADHLGSERLLVVDASVVELEVGVDRPPRLSSGFDQYLFDGHVPGAVFADLVGAFSDEVHEDDLATAAAAIGITRDHTIIVYDSADGRFAERLGLVLRRLGHGRVAVVTGGLRRWRAEGRDVEGGGADGSFPG